MIILTGVLVSIKCHFIFWIEVVSNHIKLANKHLLLNRMLIFFVSHQDKTFPRELLPLNKHWQVINWNNTHKSPNATVYSRLDVLKICMLALKKGHWLVLRLRGSEDDVQYGWCWRFWVYATSLAVIKFNILLWVQLCLIIIQKCHIQMS